MIKQIIPIPHKQPQSLDILRIALEIAIEQNEDFEVIIQDITKKRSPKQLAGYWHLVKIIKDYMNDKGNLFTDEEVSNWVKIRAGHFIEVEGLKVAKSISNKSGTTKEDMKAIIEFMIAFGIEEGIKGCYLEEKELSEMLKYFEE